MVTFYGEEFSELKTPYDTYIPTNEMGNNIIKTVTENVQLKIIETDIRNSNVNILKMKLTDAEKCANLGIIKIKNKKSMSKESTFGMKSQRAVGGGRQYGVPYGMGL